MNGSLDQAVAFTWSPDPSKFKGVMPFYQFQDTISYIEAIGLCAYYEICPEFNLNGNIHYHGTLWILDKVKWYKSVLPKLKYNGFVMIKGRVDEKWREYYMKESDVVGQVLKIKLPILYNGEQKRKKVVIYDGISPEGKSLDDPVTVAQWFNSSC